MAKASSKAKAKVSSKSASAPSKSSKPVAAKKAKASLARTSAPVVKAASKAATAMLTPPKKPAAEKQPVPVVAKKSEKPGQPPHRPAVVAAPVPTNGKPSKNQAGLSTKELEHYRELLLLKRRELVGDMSSMEREALRSTTGTNLSNLPLHMADMGTDNYEQEFTLGLVEKDRQLLREINTALAKIMDGTYGICEGTGKPINKPRLEAQPWAKYSIEYARQLEKGMIRR